MKITQIRNATVKIGYAGKTFLMDPWLMEKGGFGVLKDSPYHCPRPEQATIAMPIHDLPIPVEDVLANVDACVLTHIHPDHIDMERDGGNPGSLLPKDMPMFVQSPEDAFALAKAGFGDLTVMYENSAYAGVEIIKTPARHGTKVPCGPACGVVFRAPGEKTLYVAGDTIWYDGVLATLEKFRPGVVIVNACAAELQFFGRLIMNDEDVARVRKAAPYAKIIISHMEEVAHATISREDMRKFLRARNMEDAALIPENGDVMEL